MKEFKLFILSLIFIVGIIIYIIYVVSRKKQPTQQKVKNTNSWQKSEIKVRNELAQNYTKNIKITVTTSNLEKDKMDDSIIDVTDQSYKIGSNNLKTVLDWWFYTMNCPECTDLIY